MQNNKKTAQLYGLILGSILAIGLIGTPTALAQDPPGYTEVTDSSAEETNGKIELTVTTGADIPRLPDEFIDSVAGFGFAWLDGNEGIVAAIHPDFDDSAQNPNAWHTHTVEVDGNCASVGDSQGGAKIKDNTMTLQVPKQFAGDLNLGDAVAFKIVENTACEEDEAQIEVF
jgi:hypothetical protein